VTRLAILDTETTGLEPDRHEIYEVGLIVREPEKPDQEHRWWLPVELAKADPNALKVGRFFERHPDLYNLRLSRRWFPDRDTGVLVESGSALSPQPTSIPEAARALMRLTAGAHLVGAVPSFDAAFLSRLLRANGCCPAWHYHLVDVEALAAGYLAGFDVASSSPVAEGPKPPWSSSALSKAVGVDPDEHDRHTALGDARWARAIYDKVLGS
jgi:DNA polymerase III epsilon subunit-like protein